MTGVAAWILAQVVLVVGLGAVPGGGGLDGCRDRAAPLARGADARDDATCGLLLLGRLRKDRRAVLGADVVPLAVERGRIVQAEEPVLEQILVAQYRWVEGDAHRLGVAGLAVVRVVVRRVLEPAAGVADIRIENAGHLAQDVFDSPEAATGQPGDLGLPGTRDRGTLRAPLFAHLRLSVAWSIGKIASVRAPVNQAG